MRGDAILSCLFDKLLYCTAVAEFNTHLICEIALSWYLVHIVWVRLLSQLETPAWWLCLLRFCYCMWFSTYLLAVEWMASNRWWCSPPHCKVFICCGVVWWNNYNLPYWLIIGFCFRYFQPLATNRFYLWWSHRSPRYAADKKWLIMTMRHPVTLIYPNHTPPLWLLLNRIDAGANVSGSQTQKAWFNLHAHFHINDPTLWYSFLPTICTFGMDRSSERVIRCVLSLWHHSRMQDFRFFFIACSNLIQLKPDWLCDKELQEG